MGKEIDPQDLIEQREAEQRSVELRKQLREIEKSDFLWLMQDKRGRRFVWRLLDKAGVFRITFRPNSDEGVFLEGMRNMGLVLMADINEVCPEKYQVMVNEQEQHVSRTGS